MGPCCMSQFDLLEDIPQYTSWVKIQPIIKGWSLEKKYYIENEIGEKLLLRISDIAKYQSLNQDYEYIKSLAKLKINMPFPIDIGICAKGTCVYSLFTWVEGEDAESVLPTLSFKHQYEHGINAGRMLKKIHTIPAPLDQRNW